MRKLNGRTAWHLYCELCDASDTMTEEDLELLVRLMRNVFIAGFVANQVARSLELVQQDVADGLRDRRESAGLNLYTVVWLMYIVKSTYSKVEIIN